MKCVIRIPLVMCALSLFPILASAAESSAQKNDQAQEYIQVRKIALKDSRVQEAFQRANEKLDERILEIDPSLKPYMEKHNGPQPAAREPAKTAAAPVRHTATAHPVASTVPNGTAHIVAKGETLSSIAAHYNVSVASLKSANSITDERKLRVGQKLAIPSSKRASKSGINKPEAPAKKDQSFWEKVKNDF